MLGGNRCQVLPRPRAVASDDDEPCRWQVGRRLGERGDEVGQTAAVEQRADEEHHRLSRRSLDRVAGTVRDSRRNDGDARGVDVETLFELPAGELRVGEDDCGARERRGG